ncbi:ketopantoate reductase family protein [Cohnella mopanensis]|uniref:ketopantoate reductase family protein n=1 Tax=Cohnella mopanensis TaxID=2911966 RepID=UPI001EF80DDF|nr:2-dehydropantoate 2-reductase [Cohnella mopanensis]
MDKIAVLGGGSLGLLLAGKLNASGCNCAIWTRTRRQAALLNERGLTLENPVDNLANNFKVKATPMGEANLADNGVVLLAVKQTALTTEFLQELSASIPVGGAIVLFQNGVGHRELLKQALPGRELVTAITTEGALRLDETTVRHTGIGETRIGVEEQLDATLLRFIELLLKQAGFSVFLSKQLGEAILRKLLVNAVINPLTAILRVRNGELIESAVRLDAMRSLFHETFDILSAYGLEDEHGLWDHVLQVCEATRLNESSMLQDIGARRTTEIDSINGAVCRMAAEQGKDAPWNLAVTTLVKAIR